ncbi:hypothetical protein AVEN_210120-1, partial [Araneus ventricosus]
LILVDAACWQVEYAHARATIEHGDCDVTHELNAFLDEYVETVVTHYPCVTHVKKEEGEKKEGGEEEKKEGAEDRPEGEEGKKEEKKEGESGVSARC